MKASLLFVCFAFHYYLSRLVVKAQQCNGPCADGVGDVSNASKPLSEAQLFYPRSVPENVTCGSLDQVVFDAGDADDDCYMRQLVAHYECGCEKMPRRPEPKCNLCVKADDKPNLSAVYHHTLEFRQCIDLADYVLRYDDDSQQGCKEYQLQAFKYCGCTEFPLPPAGDTCTLCPDGSPPGSPDKTITPNSQITCATAAAEAPLRFEYPGDCPDAWEDGRNCDCPEPAGAVCDICAMGGSLVNPNARIVDPYKEDETITCQEYWNRGQSGELVAADCPAHQFLASEACCGGDYSVNCHVCEDQSPLPDPFATPGGTTACASAAAALAAADFQDGDPECTIGQAMIGGACGCDNPIALASPDLCNICDETTVFDPSATTTNTLNGQERFCNSYMASLMVRGIGDPKLCNTLRAKFANDCCRKPQDDLVDDNEASSSASSSFWTAFLSIRGVLAGICLVLQLAS